VVTKRRKEKSSKSADDLITMAKCILKKYVDAIDEEDTPESNEDSQTSDVPTDSEDDSDDTVDVEALNLKRLTGHLLFSAMLHNAIRDGDFGRIEDLQGHLTAMFCAGGSKNYYFELLYFIQHLHNVWPLEVA
jgi:hypothetical protein